MHVTLDNRFELVHELRSGPELTSRLLHSESVTQDLSDLVEEAYVSGTLAGKLPLELKQLGVEVRPVWRDAPIVGKVELELTALDCLDQTHRYVRQFASGRWVRSAQETALRLQQEGTLSEGDVAHRLLLALECDQPPVVKLPHLEPPLIVDQTLEDFGICSLAERQLVPDRPVLVNERLVTDCVQRCEEAGATEIGGAVLGKVIRLKEPLPGTETPIVTILSATVEDPRHVGAPLSFTFSPEGLAEAARIGDLRGLGETVQTVFHTHGWGTSCGNCNQNAKCLLAEGNPSLQDYILLDSLFSSKSTLMPIAGRKLGDSGRRPVLQIHAWRGGEMRPIRFQQYRD